MNAFITILCICIIVTIIAIIYARRSNLRDNGSSINEARDNNKRSEDINIKARKTIVKLSEQNRTTIDITRELEAGNREARELNNDILRSNTEAGDIIKEVRKQKLD